MNKRKLKELNLLDDFLFFKMLNYPEFGEEFSRELLKVIFGKNFGKLVVVPQKVYYGSDTDKHGARIDVYLEESHLEDELLEGATIYDVEPELNDKKANIESLPKRVRFYHSIIDADSLKCGADYTCLKKVVIIMITPFDPFCYNRMIYTIRNSCKELLEYMENTNWEKAKNDTLKKIHSMVEVVKREKGVTLEYMKIFEREQMLREEGEARGKFLGEQKSLVETYQEFGKAKEETIKKAMEKFQLDKEDAEEVVERYWKR